MTLFVYVRPFSNLNIIYFSDQKALFQSHSSLHLEVATCVEHGSYLKDFTALVQRCIVKCIDQSADTSYTEFASAHLLLQDDHQVKTIWLGLLG